MLVYFKYTWALQDPIIDICMIPHKSCFEIIVIPVSVDPLKGRYPQKYSRQGIQEIVVDIKLCEISKYNKN